MPHNVDREAIHRRVAQALARFNEPAQSQADGVRLGRWPTVRIAVDDATASPNLWGEEQWDSGTWSAHFDLTVQLEAGFRRKVATQAIGQGLSRDDAIKDAVETWTRCVAPALLSHICRRTIAEADLWQPSDLQGVPGWVTIAGPALLLGEAHKTAGLGAFLQSHSIVAPLRPHLVSALARRAPFHSLSLYRAVTPQGVVADVLIDNVRHQEASEALKGANWPATLSETAFLSARRFLLCVSAVRGALP